MDIRPATRADVDRLVDAVSDWPAAQHHFRERWRTQVRDEGLFLLAHRDGEVVGYTLLLRRSKYAEVRAAVDPVEINALYAYVKNQGIGTAIIRAAETIAADWARSTIGLAVSPDNPNAQRLYERLGYRRWPGRPVVDVWTEQDAEGNIVRSHEDRCDYLLKSLR